MPLPKFLTVASLFVLSVFGDRASGDSVFGDRASGDLAPGDGVSTVERE